MSYLPSLGDIRSLQDPAPSWRWILRVPTDFVTVYANSALPFIMAEQIVFALTDIDSDQRFGGGIRQNYPRFQTAQPLSITFYETQQYSTIRYLSQWKKRVVNPETHNYGVPLAYKRNMYLYAFDYVSNTRPTFVGIFRDCWPTNVGGLNFSYDSSQRITVQAEFACDKSFLEY